MVNNPPTNARDEGLIPGSGRSPGGGNSNPFQYSCLENPMDSGAWWARVLGIAKNQTPLSTHKHKGKHINSYFIVESPGRHHLNQKPQVNITSINMTKVAPGGRGQRQVLPSYNMWEEDITSMLLLPKCWSSIWLWGNIRKVYIEGHYTKQLAFNPPKCQGYIK